MRPPATATALLFFQRPSLSKGKEELCENLRTGASFWSILVFSVSRPGTEKNSGEEEAHDKLYPSTFFSDWFRLIFQ